MNFFELQKQLEDLPNTSLSMQSAHCELLEDLEGCWEQLDDLDTVIETIIKSKKFTQVK